LLAWLLCVYIDKHINVNTIGTDGAKEEEEYVYIYKNKKKKIERGCMNESDGTAAKIFLFFFAREETTA
jgi:hypothetical protein